MLNTSVMGWVFEGVHGHLVPDSHLRGCSLVTKWPWKISSNMWRQNQPTQTAASMHVQCLLAQSWDIAWRLTQKGDYHLLRDFTASKSNQVFLERLPSTWTRVKGKENREYHQANCRMSITRLIVTGIDHCDTLWVGTPLKHCLFR